MDDGVASSVPINQSTATPIADELPDGAIPAFARPGPTVELEKELNMLIKPIHSIRALAALVAAASLVACATPAGQDHDEHHPGQSANTMAAGSSGTPPAQGGMMGGGMAGSQGGCGMMGGATAGNQAGCGMMGSSQSGSRTGSAGGMQQMNKEDMCAMYRNMRDAPNEQARQAMMDRHMQDMSPGMRQQQMEMMRQQCQ